MRRRRYGPTFITRAFLKRTVVVSEYKDVKRLLGSDGEELDGELARARALLAAGRLLRAEPRDGHRNNRKPGPKFVAACPHAAKWPDSTRQMLGELAVSNLHGREHARMRRALQPLFSPAAVRGYLPQIQGIAEEFAERWIERGTVTGACERAVLRLPAPLCMRAWLEAAACLPACLGFIAHLR